MTSGLHRICTALAEELSLGGVTITVMTGAGIEAAAAASDATIQAMSDTQFVLGEGPSHDSFQTGRPVLIPELAASGDRWVGFTPDALAAGVTGAYAFPLGLGATRLGVMACYSADDRQLQPRELDRCLTVAEDVTTMLLSGSPGDGVLSDPDVQRSLQIRTEVYQAQGMLKVALGVSLSEALTRLRAMAYAEDIDINVLAAELVHGRRPFPSQADDQ